MDGRIYTSHMDRSLPEVNSSPIHLGGEGNYNRNGWAKAKGEKGLHQIIGLRNDELAKYWQTLSYKGLVV